MSEFIFKMPDIGEGIVEAEVVAWHVAPGDTVKEDAPLADVMTDKATVEITSPVAGVVRSTGCNAGDKVVIGSDLVVFDVEGIETSTTTTSTDNDKQAASSDKPETAEIEESEDLPTANPESVPSVPASTTDKPKIRVVSDSTSETTNATSSRPVKATPAKPESRGQAAGARVGSALVGVPNSNNGNNSESRAVLASPAVRKLARDAGIDLTGIEGNGPQGRILKEDLPAASNAQASKSGNSAKVTPLSSAPGSAQSSAENADFEDIPLFGMRRIIAERMEASKRNIPHFSYVEEVAVDSVETLRAELNSQRLDSQPKLSLLHFVLLAVAGTAPRWPQCNAHYLDEGPTLRQYRALHIGVATMTEAGLMVPVLRNAEQLGIWEIAAEVNRLAEGARAGTLSRDELTGSTITVTSLGALAGISTTPVINRPETSVIGPNKIREKVIMREGQASVSRVMNLSSSFDHRVVDGYDAACMVQELKRLLEQPALMFMR